MASTRFDTCGKYSEYSLCVIGAPEALSCLPLAIANGQAWSAQGTPLTIAQVWLVCLHNDACCENHPVLLFIHCFYCRPNAGASLIIPTYKATAVYVHG